MKEFLDRSKKIIVDVFKRQAIIIHQAPRNLYIYISDYEFGTPTSRGYPPGNFGTLWLRLHIHFTSCLPISIDSVMLNLMGKYIFPSVEWEPGRMRTEKRDWSDQSSSYCHYEQYFYFDVPSLDGGEEYRVQIVASAEGKEWEDDKLIFFPTTI